LRVELTEIEEQAGVAVPQVHPAWVRTRLERLGELLSRDPVRARIEILKHLDGDLNIFPSPRVAGVRRAEIRGRVKSESLLADQEAVRLLVCGSPSADEPAVRY